jgi:hypothetical protein
MEDRLHAPSAGRAGRGFDASEFHRPDKLIFGLGLDFAIALQWRWHPSSAEAFFSEGGSSSGSFVTAK